MARSSRLSGSVHKGPWTPDEDLLLTRYIEAYGEGHWPTLPQKAGLKRCGKSCRLRWKNYLCPSIKRGHISPDEEELIIRLHKLLGNRWSVIAGRIPGRTGNDIKNYWNTHLSKKVSDKCNRLKVVDQQAVTPNTSVNAASSSSCNNPLNAQPRRSGNVRNSTGNHNGMENVSDLSVAFATEIKEEAIGSCSELAAHLLTETEELSNPSPFNDNNNVLANFDNNLQFNATIESKPSSIVQNHGIGASNSVISSIGPHDAEYQTYHDDSHTPSLSTELVISDAYEWMVSDLFDIPLGVLDCNYMQYYSEQNYGSECVTRVWPL